MGAWGELAFDNDTACDWAYELENVDDLSLVESAFDEVDANGANYLDQDVACNASIGWRPKRGHHLIRSWTKKE